MDANAIFGEARKAPENADRVEYAIFPDELGTDQGESGQAVLDKLRARLSDFIRPFIEGYIWQKDAFNLRAVHALSSPPGWKVEDEGQAGKLRAHDWDIATAFSSRRKLPFLLCTLAVLVCCFGTAV